jgi:cell division protein FtsB
VKGSSAGPPSPPPPGDAAAPRPLRSLLVALFVFLVLLLATFGLRGWQDVSRARARERALAEQVAATEARIAELKRRIARLQDDPVTLDRMAREQLGWVAPGDVVIVLPEPPAADPPPVER